MWVFFFLYEYLLHRVLFSNIENMEMLFIRMSINLFFSNAFAYFIYIWVWVHVCVCAYMEHV